jgi:hypothetical protein
MLPPGITADPLPSSELASFRTLLPPTQTAGDLIRPRLPDSREDERHLRARYKALGLPRDRIVRELETHRRAVPAVQEPVGGWRAALAAFVAEHARNAGPTLFRLTFHPAPGEARAAPPPLRRTIAEIRAQPERWLEEGRPILVLR